MSYIGNNPISQAFLTDQFSGNGTTTAFTMSVAPATTSSILVAVTGVVQDPSTYSVVGTTLTFTQAPPTGTGNISVRYLGIPATGVTTTAYRTLTEFTATAGQTTFTPPSYTVGFLNVYRNGVLLGSADYTATNGTTVVLAKAASAGDLVTTESFYVSSVLNAIPATAGAVNSSYLANNLTLGGTTTMSTGILLGSSTSTLSTYQEGTFTPTCAPQNSGSITYTASGQYVKIGKECTIQIVISISAVSAPAGNLTVSGLPFAGSNILAQRQIMVAREDGATGKMGQMWVDANATTGAVQDYTGATGASVMTAGYRWLITGSYITAS